MKAFMTMFLVLLVAVSAYSLTIRDIQYTENSSGDSPYDGQTVTVTGVVTRAYAKQSGSYLRYYTYIQDDTTSWSGLLLYGVGLEPGDSVTVTGTIVEYSNKTEMSPVESYTIHKSNAVIPGPVITNTGDLNDEQWESVFVVTNNIVVSNAGTSNFDIDDGSGAVEVYTGNKSIDYTPVNGDSLLFIAGVMDQYYSTYELLPLENKDILKSIDGSGEARVNPKYASDGEFIFPSVDSIYGIIDFIRVRFPADSMIDTVSITANTDSIVVNRDSLNNRITVDLFNVHMIDTVSMYIGNRYFTGPDTFKVYTGLTPAYFAYISELPIVDVLPDMNIMSIGEVQSTSDGYNSIYNGQSVTIRGIVTGPSSIFTPTATSTGFYMEDETGGVNIYSSSDAMNNSFKTGMQLILTGTVEEYNGLTEVKYSSPDTSILIINDTFAMLQPEILNNSQGINEFNEGKLVEAEYAKVLTAPVSAGSGKNFQILNGQTMIDCRIVDKSPFYDTDEMKSIKPGMLLNVSGIGGQYDTEAPYSSGYQLQIRFDSDVEFIEAEEDSTFSVQILPNPVSFERGESARIDIKCLNDERITARVFDMKGRLITVLAENVPGSTIIVWDGRDYTGAFVNIAAYIIVVDKVLPDGSVRRINKPIIVTTDLN